MHRFNKVGWNDVNGQEITEIDLVWCQRLPISTFSSKGLCVFNCRVDDETFTILSCS